MILPVKAEINERGRRVASGPTLTQLPRAQSQKCETPHRCQGDHFERPLDGQLRWIIPPGMN